MLGPTRGVRFGYNGASLCLPRSVKLPAGPVDRTTKDLPSMTNGGTRSAGDSGGSCAIPPYVLEKIPVTILVSAWECSSLVA